MKENQKAEYKYRREQIIQQARQELEEEMYREAVEAKKVELRARKPWLHRIFPWVITINRR